MASLESIQLPGSTAVTTRVGFGCSNLLGDKTREMGLGLLHAAYECGIRHYDVARVYNYGDAEALVGEFARDKRDKITITTKFGLMPRGSVAKLKGPVQLARRIMRSSPAIRRLVRRNVQTLTQSGQFDPATARRSLEDSLRALRTEYIDVYLLHEGTVADCTDEIFAFLEQARDEGKIRAFGCGSAFEEVLPVAGDRPSFLQVAQFESSPVNPNIETFLQNKPAQTMLTVTHGGMGAADRLKTYLASNSAARQQWSESLGVDPGQGSDLFGLLLQFALRENAGGIVLFRASTPERVRANLQAMERLRLTEDQLTALRAFGIAAAKNNA